jgi:iron(II)-dependent oxidoreductase
MQTEGRDMGTVIPAAAVQTRPESDRADAMRRAGRVELEAALMAGRDRLLALFEGFERALGRDGLRIAYDPVLNLPLWELGHIGWFEEHWLARNGARRRGAAWDESAPRGASLRPDADALYDSSKVPHAQRWQLALPSPDATRAYLAQVRDSTFALLRDSAETDADLYFFRLALFHEDMHREAWHFMAQQLGVDLGPAMLGSAPKPSAAHGEWHVPAGLRVLGSGADGFAFDNELGAAERFIDAFAIDRGPVTWQRFLPFVEALGYATEALWTADGWAWRTRLGLALPRHLRRVGSAWEQRRFGRWMALDVAAPVLHVSAYEAQAWCRWAGRRLPTEAEWETAALLAADERERFDWGEVWEWTASAFEPYPGFAAHPYRDYSRPWFDGRPVLRGASFATAPQMKHPRYRNFFSADRSDVFAGFRSCAPAQGHSRAGGDRSAAAV